MARRIKKTITVKDSAKLTYYDNQRLYLVSAIDMNTGREVTLFNLNDDIPLAIAEMEFDGFFDPIFHPLDDYLTQLNNKHE